MNDDQRKHLEFIQAVITRMGNNSFLLRGWSVTLVSALFALAAKDANRHFLIISYFPCALFWFLDAYYLSQERKFRSLYDAVRAPGSTVDLYSMKTPATVGANDALQNTLFSITVLPFHATILIVIILVHCIA